MPLADLRARLAAVTTAVQISVATAAADRIEKAKAKAAETLAKTEKNREQKYLLNALPGSNEEKAKRLNEIQTAVAEYQEICGLLREAEIEKVAAANKAASADRDRLVADMQAVVDEAKAEKECIEKNPDIKFFGWLRQLESQAENPDQRVAVGEINNAIANGFLVEITGERAREIKDAVKAAKEDNESEDGWRNKDHAGKRNAPFFWVRVKPHGDVPHGEVEPDDHFRYVSGGTGFYERSTDGARKRLVFFAIQDLWKACTEAKKAAYETAKEVQKHSYLTVAEIAAGKTGQACAEVTAKNPWRPKMLDRETGEVKPFMKDGKEVINCGPVVVESVRSGVLRVLNVGTSWMYHPLRLAGAWDDAGNPVEFKFFTGDNPRTGLPNNFAGLRPVKDTVNILPAKLGRLRAILCLAGGMQVSSAKEKEEKNGSGASEVEVQREETTNVETPRGGRADGSKAGEPRRAAARNGKKKGRRGVNDEEPEVPVNVRTSADVQEE